MIRRVSRRLQYGYPPYPPTGGYGGYGGYPAATYGSQQPQYSSSYYSMPGGVSSGAGAEESASAATSSSPLPPRPPRSFDSNSFRSRGTLNTFVNIVPQGELWVVERLGKYYKTLGPGLHFLVPFVDRINYIHSAKEQGIPIPHQSAITRDNVMLEIDGVLFLKIVDAVRASYNIDNPIFNLINIAQTTMRSEIGKLTLDTLFEERDKLNQNIVEAIKREAAEWGVECKRYEIRDISVSDIVRKSMDLQAEAERKKRKVILESEGERDSAVNRAQGHRSAAELEAEAKKYTTEAISLGDLAASMNRVKSLQVLTEGLSNVLKQYPNGEGHEAMRFLLATEYMTQLGHIAKENNGVVLAAPLGDPNAMITQAMSVMKGLNPPALPSGVPPIK